MSSDPVEAAQARDRFERLFTRHYPELVRFVGRRLGVDVAGDVVAETFLVAWRRLPEIPAEHARAWLYSTARHLIAREVRTRQRRDRLDDRARDEVSTAATATPDHAAVITEQLQVRAVLASLSPLDQEVLRLTEWERLGIAEVAAVLGCSHTAAKVRLHRARRRFARRLAAAEAGLDAQPGLDAQSGLHAESGAPLGSLPDLLAEGDVTA
jgi:RNA polymerase sigma-70 factor (ECF subfamily)